MKLEQSTKKIEVKTITIKEVPEITLTMNLEEASVLFGILSTTTYSSVKESVDYNADHCAVKPDESVINRFPYELWSSLRGIKGFIKL